MLLPLPAPPDAEDGTCHLVLPRRPTLLPQLHPGLGHVSADGCSLGVQWRLTTLLEPKTR